MHRPGVTARQAVAATTLCCALIAGGAAQARAGGTSQALVPAAATPTLSQLVGQRIVVAFTGTTAGTRLLARIRAGHIGGVILFGSNIASPSQLKALTATLQKAAHDGGQPRLLITTDQEGGLVKRIPWAPPRHSAQQLGQLPTGQSHTAGSLTGAALRADGVNIDLAPVADVPTGPSDFIEQQHRAFSTSRFIVAKDASAFADGLESHKVWPVLKHFPGLGRATVSTDDALVHITATAQQLGRAWLPYRIALRQGLDPMVMLSTAVYPALDRRGAAWSPTVIKGILRKRLGFTGVTITDSLDAAAHVRHTTDSVLALKSAAAGSDLLLVTGSQATSRAVFRSLLAAAGNGTLPMGGLNKSYARILALKAQL
jgi:beta-N-acetylhexosaminidase